MKNREYRSASHVRAALCVSLLLGWSLASCDRCDETGCEALTHRADAKIAQGIAGAIASRSDVESNGCQECPFRQATLRVWPTEEAVTSAQEADTVIRSETPISIAADGRYEQALAPGDYLFCEFNVCTSVAVLNDKVTTVNVNSGDGISTIYVFEPGEDLRVTEYETCQRGEYSRFFCP